MPSGHLQVVQRKRQLEKRTDPSACSNFYISPTNGEVVNSLDPLAITWNTSCLSVPAIDIYLYSPGAALPRIHVWEGIALSRGTYNATLMPRWWNSTASQTLQVSIVVSGQPPFLATLPGSPAFIATYTAPASGTPASADTSQLSSGITQVDDLAPKNGLSPGKKAAAVLLTLLFVGLCIAGYLKFKRNKGKKDRKRWTEAVDKRMSTISSDWKSVSVAGANAAIRSSVAVGSRSSAFSFGAIRPSSTVAVENDNEKRPLSQMRTGVGLRNPITPILQERVSRVSFAPDTRISRASAADSRPSGESRRTRAFHTGYVPPLPGTPDPDDSDLGSLSPRQSQGALTLTPDDIQARLAANKRSRCITPNDISNLGDEVLPALKMVMSPDDMLRAYAEGKKSMAAGKPLTPSPSLSPISYPKAVVKKRSIRASLKGASNTMRGLYNATRSLSPVSPSSPSNIHTDVSPVPGSAAHGQSISQSLAPTNDDVSSFYESVGHEQSPSLSESYESGNVAGMGTANAHPFGYHPYAYNYTIGGDDDNAGVAEQDAGAEADRFGRAS